MAVSTINMFSLSATVSNGPGHILRRDPTVTPSPAVAVVAADAAEAGSPPSSATVTLTVYTVPQAITAAQIAIARSSPWVYSQAAIYSLTLTGDNWLELRDQPSTITWANIVDITFELFLNSTDFYDGAFTNPAPVTVAQTLYSQPPFTGVPQGPENVEPVRTSHLVYDSATGQVLHHHQTAVLPGAKAPSDSAVVQDALKLAASVAGVPSTQKTAVLNVDAGKLQAGVTYKVDVKATSLVALNPHSSSF